MEMDTTQLERKMKNIVTLPSQASHVLIIPLPRFIMHFYWLLKKIAY
jgi:hypothetical protein